MHPDDPRHGTDAGYRLHRKANQDACRPCLDAHAARSREQRAGITVQAPIAFTGTWQRRGLIYYPTEAA